MTDRQPVPERPRSEPEIIPPGAADARSRWGTARMWTPGSQRVYVARVGPFGFAMAALAVAIIAAIIFLLLLGAFVIVIPLAGLLLAAAVFGSMLRGSFRR
jgi:hypothetical protein